MPNRSWLSRLLLCSWLALAFGCEDAADDAADPAEGGPVVTPPSTSALSTPTASWQKKVGSERPPALWYVRVGELGGPAALLATAHRLHTALPEQRIVSAPDGDKLMLVAAPPTHRRVANKLRERLETLLPRGVLPTLLACEAKDGQCPLWQAIAISPTFYGLDPLDLPEQVSELLVTSIAATDDVKLKAVPYFDEKDDSGHTEGFLTRVDVESPYGAFSVDKLCWGGSISPRADKVAVECVRDYIADTPRFRTTVYSVADGSELRQFAPCRGTSWAFDGSLICMGDWVDGSGEVVETPGEVGRYQVVAPPQKRAP